MTSSTPSAPSTASTASTEQNSYRKLFSPPGSLAFSAAVLVARFPMGMLSLAGTLLVTGLHHGYTLAGLGGAVVLATIALAGPQQARLVDTYGQSRVSRPAALIAAAGAAGVVLTLHQNAPVWAYLVCCAVSALGPNTGSLARSRWAHLHAGDAAALHTAYAYEGVLDELCFVLGPLAVLALVAGFSPLLAYAAAEALALGGVLALSAQRRTEPPLAGGESATASAEGAGTAGRAGRRSALRSPGLPALVLVLAATGAVFGTQEITTVGFAQHLGARDRAGLVLSCYALGSCLSGVLLGLWKPRGRPVVRLRIALAAMAVTLAPLTLVRSLPEAAAVLFVAGFTTAPTVSTAIGYVAELVPAGRLTEGFTWTTTGLMVGNAAGTALAGRLVDTAAPGAGYRLPAVAAALALAASLLLPRAIRCGAAPADDAEAAHSPREGDAR